LERLLKRSGYQVLTAESGVDAIKVLLDNPCQVVISDFRMPGMTGGELLKQIDQLYPQTVCMVLSGYADFSAVIDLLNAGIAFRFLQKPWDDEQLLLEVKAAFNKFHAARSL
ncbi:response regulator, partial [Arthrospira platensis SPKY1]|nr:response regulator [Arthrospira platensis SPKY1]